MQSVRAFPGKRHGRMPGGNRRPTRPFALRPQTEKDSFWRDFSSRTSRPARLRPHLLSFRRGSPSGLFPSGKHNFDKGPRMKIIVIGSGYVGLVTAACFSEVGLDVWCMDTDAAKVAKLNAGGCPIYEPALPELLARNAAAGRLHFTTSLEACLDGADAAFIAVGTPEGEDGSADLTYVCNAARSVGQLMKGDLVVVVKVHGSRGHLRQGGGHSPRGTRRPGRFLQLRRGLQSRISQGRSRRQRLHDARPRHHRRGKRPRPRHHERAVPPLHDDRRPHAVHGSRLVRAHQVHGQRHARHAHFVHERHSQSLRARGRQRGHGAQGHRHGSPHRAQVSVRGLRLRRFLLSQGREGPHCHRRPLRLRHGRASGRGTRERPAENRTF